MKIVEADYQAFLKLLSLVGIDALSTPSVFRYDGENCTEMQLKPTKTHLKSLIDYLAEKTPFRPLYTISFVFIPSMTVTAE